MTDVQPTAICPRCEGVNPDPDFALCRECAREVMDYATIVAEGGAYWICDVCGESGVIPDGDAAREQRTIHGIAAPAPLMLVFPSCIHHRGPTNEAAV